MQLIRLYQFNIYELYHMCATTYTSLFTAVMLPEPHLEIEYDLGKDYPHVEEETHMRNASGPSMVCYE
jgi:hypothetical protein